MSASEDTSMHVAMVAGSFYIPKKNPKSPLGEDAHFIDEDVQVIGVADGVGAFKLKGIDAGKFARELMGKAAKIVKKRRYPFPYVNPKLVLREAFSKSRSPGACTACIVALDGNLLRAANVGDSGFVVIRRGKVVFRSPVQQTEFNCPYQIGDTAGGPTMAEEFEVAVQAGDVVIVCSDGLFDNLFLKEILEVVRISLEQNDQPNVLAKSLATAALERSLDRSCRSPFAVAARAAGRVHNGGKYDDITVVAAYVQDISKAKNHKFYISWNWWSKTKLSIWR